MIVVSLTVHSFDELSGGAKKRASEEVISHFNLYSDFEYQVDEFKSFLTTCGFVNIDVRFRHSYSQGDGASFTGHWRKENMPWGVTVELNPCYWNLLKQITGVYFLYGEIMRDCQHYSHEKTISAYEYKDGDYVPSTEFQNWTEAACKAFFKKIVEAYEYSTSEKNVLYTCEVHDLVFDKNGNIFWEDN